jgi:hypothetical protein
MELLPFWGLITKGRYLDIHKDMVPNLPSFSNNSQSQVIVIITKNQGMINPGGSISMLGMLLPLFPNVVVTIFECPHNIFLLSTMEIYSTKKERNPTENQ